MQSLLKSGRLVCGLKSAPGCKVLILNRKGGAGKSTFSISLASVLQQQHSVEMVDFDAQRTAHFWTTQSQLVPGQAFNFDKGQVFSLAVKVDRSSEVIILDTPSNFTNAEMERYLTLADRIIIPVQPSPVDIHAILGFMTDLMRSPTFKQRNIPVAFVATRNPNGEEAMEQFRRVLGHLRHPVLGYMSNTDNYQQAFNQGMSFLAIDPDLDSALWQNVEEWLAIAPPAEAKVVKVEKVKTATITRFGSEKPAEEPEAPPSHVTVEVQTHDEVEPENAEQNADTALGEQHNGPATAGSTRRDGAASTLSPSR
uniref:ParA family protein n=1 Tax=Thaumasiovibrio occultus TaxID=1891184 RepID=UPI00131EA000|nr:ParA family protein [Thaumasiovibrio occultus]